MDLPSDSSSRLRAVRHRRRVLFAEDAQELGSTVEATLADAGWDVERVRDAQALLQSIALPPGGVLPDVVLFDPLLPGASGLDVVARLHATWPAVPVVLLTTRGVQLTPEQAKSAGAQGIAPRVVDGVALGAYLAGTVVEAHRRRLAGLPPGKTVPPEANAFLQAVQRLERRGPVQGEKRVEQRFELRTPRDAKLRIPSEEEPRIGKIRDVSSRGLMVRHSGASVPVGTRVEVELDLKDGAFLPHVVKVPATVRWTQWVQGAGNDVGVELDEPESKLALKVVYSLLVGDV